MSFVRRRGIQITFILVAPLIYFSVNYAVKSMISVFKKDFGNGVVIYADEYVNTGRWVFDCRYSRLISRQPLPAPIAALQRADKFTIGSMYNLQPSDVVLAKQAIRATTAKSQWYNNLRYLYSVLDEYSNIAAHVFDLPVQHDGRQWAFHVWQDIQPNGTSGFTIFAELYEPENYIDYAKALEAAAKSCPTPQ